MSCRKSVVMLLNLFESLTGEAIRQMALASPDARAVACRLRTPAESAVGGQ